MTPQARPSSDTPRLPAHRGPTAHRVRLGALTALAVVLLVGCAADEEEPTTAPAAVAETPAGDGVPGGGEQGVVDQGAGEHGVVDRSAHEQGADDAGGRAAAAAGPSADGKSTAPGTSTRAQPPAAELPVGIVSFGVVDPTLGPGTSVSAAGLTADAVAELRADPSYEGAISTTQYFVAAWRDAITTGDGARLRDVAAPKCAFCLSVADSSEAAPLMPQDGFDVSMTIWPLGDSPARDDFPYPAATVGMELVVLAVSDIDGVPHGEVIAQEYRKLSIAAVRTGDRWSVHGVSSTPWDGTIAEPSPVP